MILTSSDGTAWTDRSVDPFYELYAIAYGNDTFIVAGDAGKLLSSRDAVTWKRGELIHGGGTFPLRGKNIIDYNT